MIDFHCHTENPLADFSIVNYSPENTIVSKFYSIGIHPWDCSSEKLEVLEGSIKIHKGSPGFLALGEIGLDKMNGAKFSRQTQIFEAQLQLATSYKIPTIIIHCVKAHNECLKIIKSSGFKGNLILHNFHGSSQVYNSYNRICDSFLSVNLTFLLAKKNIELTKTLGPNKILLETDDKDHKTLLKSYAALSKVLNIKQNLIIKAHNQTFSNFLSS